MSAARVPRLGVLDWGIGGMGVVRALRQRGLDIPVLYLSDAGSAPYGKVSRAVLAARVSAVSERLAADGATAVVVACNAASTVLDAVGEVGVPVVGVIAPALALVPARFTGTIGVIGGARTIRSGLYRRGLARAGRRVLSRVAQPLSAHVEGGTTSSDAFAVDLDRIMRPLRDVDLLILACTHYPAIAAAIGARAPRARLVDPCDALVEHVAHALPLPRLAAPDRMLTTGDPAAMRAATRRAWGFDPGRCERASW